MKQLSGTTVTGGMTAFGLSATACFAWGTLQASSSWVIAGCVCVALAILLFVLGWLVPRIFRSHRAEPLDESTGVKVDHDPNLNVQANVARKNDGGIELNMNVSVPGEDEADPAKDEDV
jgi:phosphate/sulfate permease